MLQKEKRREEKRKRREKEEKIGKKNQRGLVGSGHGAFGVRCEKALHHIKTSVIK